MIAGIAIDVEGRRYVFCLYEEERRTAAQDRATILESLDAETRVWSGNKGSGRFLKTEGGSRFAIDEKLFTQELGLNRRALMLNVCRRNSICLERSKPGSIRQDSEKW